MAVDEVKEEGSRRVLLRLASKIRDHAHFMAVLASAPPHLRQIVYDTCRANLSFKAKPLDVYISMAGQRAEREQMPTIDDKGNLTEFRPGRDVRTIEHDAQRIADEAVAERVLILNCYKCTFQQIFTGTELETKVDVTLKARAEGWIYDYLRTPPGEVCPNCPTSLRTPN